MLRTQLTRQSGASEGSSTVRNCASTGFRTLFFQAAAAAGKAVEFKIEITGSHLSRFYSPNALSERPEMRLNLPRVVSIKQGTQTTLTGKQNGYFENVVVEAKSMLSDHEVLILLLWAIISPVVALSYIVWKKYDTLKWLAVPLFLAGIVQFAGQWGGVLWVLNKFFGVS